MSLSSENDDGDNDQNNNNNHCSSDELTDDCVTLVKKRWNLLANAVLGRGIGKCGDREKFVTKNLNFFNLFDVHALPKENCAAAGSSISSGGSAVWYEYNVEISRLITSVKIRLSLRDFTIAELTGFNNTGNVRVWPSEEILAFVALKRETFFRNKNVLEVGGGMSCLAGVILARRVECRSVRVTDGNAAAVANVREIVKENSFKCPLSCDELVWKDHTGPSSTTTTAPVTTSTPITITTAADPASGLYDVIIAADCLFFDDCRSDLIRLMATLLKPNGAVLVVAPRRGDTLPKFAEAIRDFGFRCSIYRYYDDVIWSRHLQFEKRDDYVEDIHYPLLLVLNNVSEREILWHDLTASD